MKKTLKVPTNLVRFGTSERGDNGTLKLSISSEEPYKRYDWFNGEEYWEVLDHSREGVDLARLKAGTALLFNHRRDIQLGTINSPELRDGRCYVMSKLSDADDVKSYRTRIDEGILKDTSVGYEIVGDGECIGAKEGLPVYKFKFLIHEASMVTIPADITVGVGRAHKESDTPELRELEVEVTENQLDSQSNPTHNPATNMKLTPSAAQHFRNADKGGAPGGGSSATVEQPKPTVAEYRALCRKISDFVGALTNPKWREAVQKIADKHMDTELPDFEGFRTEANNAIDKITSAQQQDRSHPDIEVIGDRPQRALTVGAQFVQSKRYKDEAKNTGRQRTISIDTDMTMVGLHGKAMMAQRAMAGTFAERAGFNSSDITAINVAPQQTLVALGMHRLTILDLIAPGTTDAAAIPYPKETSQGTLDGVAVTAGLPKAGMVGERGLKPLWEPDITTDSASVKKIAVITKVPDEFLSDFAGAQSYIDARLPAMVDYKAEEQVLYGDGIGNNIKGIFTNAGILTRVYATDWFTTIRKAITDVEVQSLFTVDAIAMHPYDWEVASLEKDLNGQPLAGGPFYVPYGNGLYVEVRTFWGKRVVTTTAVAVGRPLVGAWKLGAQYFMREGMSLTATNSNEDDFRKNLMAIRAEERLALATYRPACFLEVTGGPARA